MQRPLHNRYSQSALKHMAGYHETVVQEVREAIDAHSIVVVGMAHNPHVIKARKLLNQANIDYRYLEYGSYFSNWRPRLAIKLWSGWPTYPQVFVQGELLGGAKELKAALSEGRLDINKV